MPLQIIEAVAAVLFPALGILNAYLLNQVRVEISGLKIEFLEVRAQDQRDLKDWVEREFLRRETSLDRFTTINARLDKLELRKVA